MIGMLSSVKLPLELEHATEHSFRNGQSGTNTEYGVSTEHGVVGAASRHFAPLSRLCMQRLDQTP